MPPMCELPLYPLITFVVRELCSCLMTAPCLQSWFAHGHADNTQTPNHQSVGVLKLFRCPATRRSSDPLGNTVPLALSCSQMLVHQLK